MKTDCVCIGNKLYHFGKGRDIHRVSSLCEVAGEREERDKNGNVIGQYSYAVIQTTGLYALPTSNTVFYEFKGGKERSYSYGEWEEIKATILPKFGPFKEFYPSGKLKAKGTYGFDMFSELIGHTPTAWSEPHVECPDSYPTGLYEEYYENGQLKSKVYFNKKGIKDGLFETYYENGQLKLQAQKRNGKWEGRGKAFFENGQLRLMVDYAQGQFNGVYEEYDETGKEIRKEFYQKGKEVSAQEAERRGIDALLKQIDENMAPTQKRRLVKRTIVADYREKHPKKGISARLGASDKKETGTTALKLQKTGGRD